MVISKAEMRIALPKLGLLIPIILISLNRIDELPMINDSMLL